MTYQYTPYINFLWAIRFWTRWGMISALFLRRRSSCRLINIRAKIPSSVHMHRNDTILYVVSCTMKPYYVSTSSLTSFVRKSCVCNAGIYVRSCKSTWKDDLISDFIMNICGVGIFFVYIRGSYYIHVHIVLQIIWWVNSIYYMSLHLCYIICNLTHLVSLLYICNITLYAMWWMIRMIYNVHDLHRYDISDNNRLGIIERIVSVHAKYRYVHVPIRIS